MCPFYIWPRQGSAGISPTALDTDVVRPPGARTRYGPTWSGLVLFPSSSIHPEPPVHSAPHFSSANDHLLLPCGIPALTLSFPIWTKALGLSEILLPSFYCFLGSATSAERHDPANERQLAYAAPQGTKVLNRATVAAPGVLVGTSSGTNQGVLFCSVFLEDRDTHCFGNTGWPEVPCDARGNAKPSRGRLHQGSKGPKSQGKAYRLSGQTAADILC